MEVGSVIDRHLSGAIGKIDPLVCTDSALDRQLTSVIEHDDAPPAETDARGDIGDAFDLDDAGGSDLLSFEVQRAVLSNQDEGVVGAVREGEVVESATWTPGNDGESAGNRLDHELAREGRDALAEQGRNHGSTRVTARDGQG